MKKKFIHILCICAVLFCTSGCGFESVEEHDKKAISNTSQVQKKDHKKSKKEKNTAKQKTEDTKESVEETPKSVEERESTDTKKEDVTAKVDTPQQNPSQNENAVPDDQKQNEIQYVTIQIDVLTMITRLDQVAENKRAYVPSDGWILKPIRVELEEGDTAFSVLERVTRMNRIPISYQGASGNVYNTVYVQGINQLFEFDCGQGSGWMYYVNGSYVSVGSSSYQVKNGDVISWRYTCDNGKDM